MPAAKKWFQTTAIDYPNSRPHIGTAFEKLGADVQARYRRMEGYDVFFLMGNDENTVKVAKAAAELGQDVQAYCDDMARQFQEVWDALDISYDTFVQTSEPRHHHCCRTFIQKVYDNGYIRKGKYEGWYCEGCEAFKTEKEVKEANGACPMHPTTPVIRRSEPCYFFELSKFQDRLLKHLRRTSRLHPAGEPAQRDRRAGPDGGAAGRQHHAARRDLGHPRAVRRGVHDLRLVRRAADLHHRHRLRQPTTPSSASGGRPTCTSSARTSRASTAHSGRRCCWAAGEEPPRMVFGHGFVYMKNEETGAVERISKSLGNVVEPMEIVTKFTAEAFRYYFLRECPFPGDGEFSWQRFAEVYNADLANNFGNLYSRVVTLITKNYDGVLAGTAGRTPKPVEGTESGGDRARRSAATSRRAGTTRRWRRSGGRSSTRPTSTPRSRPRGSWSRPTRRPPAACCSTCSSRCGRRRSCSSRSCRGRRRRSTGRSTSRRRGRRCGTTTRRAAAAPEDLRVLAELDAGKVKPLFPRIS